MYPMDKQLDGKIKVLIADDHSVVRKGLRLFLECNDRFEVCGEAENLKDAITLVDKKRPNVIILDFKLPDGDGIIGCINIKARFPDTKIIILTAYTDEGVAVEAIRAGADAYLLKDIESDKLISTVLLVCRGQSILDTSVTKDVFKSLRKDNKRCGSKYKLSKQEVKIMELLTLGKINKEIAVDLGISDKTVRNYISRIFRKLNVSNRTEAASYWIRKNTN